MPDNNDYAAGCIALWFVLDQAWDAFVAWNEAKVGMVPPRAEVQRALAALDREYLEVT